MAGVLCAFVGDAVRRTAIEEGLGTTPSSRHPIAVAAGSTDTRLGKLISAGKQKNMVDGNEIASSGAWLLEVGVRRDVLGIPALLAEVVSPVEAMYCTS